MYNKVIMIGRLVNHPDLIKTPKDKHVCRVSIAVNRRFKNAEGERQVDFVNLVLWGRLAESMASYGSKGSLISLDGELRIRKYEKDGKMTYMTEVLCQSYQLLESRAQRAVRENNLADDLCDLVLDEEALPF
ncbi:single-stranded DNA-binding protein [Streptococcus porcinus]|uniref:Single-stranded DNA-binding protein n=1 Tax=Streptococcus porcinus str. Jelinkova 176 TaxID=873448 RepID=A0ABN0CTD0_STRPO|nr:single-stranded DNA-binding protein [Streptococcus porcinus]EGJ26411.1 single-stranded DNA-binding protein [Streptococcus porcinus str. Jelinkova 176]SQG42440.1 single-stranded DNA-binding protein [Streptococcus porcinus]